MPRRARKKSESGIYHAILRGINKQTIFEDEEDYNKFKQVLQDCKRISGYYLFAYCLMGNHVHLLIKEEKEDLNIIFKRIGSRYVYWYNNKYQRTGHLFQDRYKSEPVDNDLYFLSVLRYILQNPVKAGLCDDPASFQWSNYSAYAGKTDFTDTEFVLSLFSADREEACMLFDKYLREDEKVVCIDINEGNRLTDKEAREIIQKFSGAVSSSEFQVLAPARRDEILALLKENGLSIRQIVRLTGISFGIVRKA
jgi:REP element-mobilizing transposase RayT